jgi:hypothetical protein
MKMNIQATNDPQGFENFKEFYAPIHPERPQSGIPSALRTSSKQNTSGFPGKKMAP